VVAARGCHCNEVPAGLLVIPFHHVGMQVGTINRKLKGWSNYFRLGTVSKAYRNVNSHVRHRVRQWLCAKFKVQGNGKKRFHDQHLHQKLGLYQLQRT
jgi:RNA-directed DNA polymerase